MSILLSQAVKHKRRAVTAHAVRPLGAFGLFGLAILDSTPVPTFGGPDILVAVLAATHRSPWYECASVAAAGSLIGAFLTFRLARKAGMTYLQSKFGNGKLPGLLRLFHRWGTAVLAASAAVPVPFPTSVFFAAAGTSGYRTRKFVGIVGVCRAARYALLAILADHYGRHFTRVIRHPDRYWGWLLLFATIVAGITVALILMNRRLLRGDGALAVEMPADPA